MENKIKWGLGWFDGIQEIQGHARSVGSLEINLRFVLKMKMHYWSILHLLIYRIIPSFFNVL